MLAKVDAVVVQHRPQLTPIDESAMIGVKALKRHGDAHGHPHWSRRASLLAIGSTAAPAAACFVVDTQSTASTRRA